MKITKETLKRVIKEEYNRLQNESSRYFNDYGYQEKDYPGYKEMDRRERGGMGYDEPEEDEMPMPAPRAAPKPAMAAAKPAPEVVSPKVEMARQFVYEYNRADNADALPGNFFDARKDRIDILRRAKQVAYGDDSVTLTPEELEGFYQRKP